MASRTCGQIRYSHTQSSGSVEKSRGWPGTLPTQDGHLVSQSNEFELQRSAAAQPEREQGTEGRQKGEHVDDGMTGHKKRFSCAAVLTFEQAQAGRR